MIKNKKKALSIILKILIAVLAYGYIIHRLNQYKISDFIPQRGFIDSKNLLLLFVVLLMPVNWLIESIKWRFLLKKIEKIILKKAFIGVLSGISFAIFTPNRIGELGGRVFVLNKRNRVKAVFASFAGSLSQFLITLLLGFIAWLILIFYYEELLSNIDNKYLNLVKIIGISSVLLVSAVFFNFNFFVKLLSKIKFLKKVSGSIKILKKYTVKELIKALLFSLSRYLIFLFQFYLLLIFFDVKISIFEAFLGISLTYFTVSIIPSITLAEIGIRGSASIFFIGLFSSDSPSILSASILLWLINLAVPAVIGSVLFFRTIDN